MSASWRAGRDKPSLNLSAIGTPAGLVNYPESAHHALFGKREGNGFRERNGFRDGRLVERPT